MTTLVEHIIVAGVENHPPMLEKSMYDSWESRIRLFIKGKKHGRMMLDSIDNGPLVYPTVKENRQTRPKKYSELTEAQQLQDDYDVQAMNIIPYGLLPDVMNMQQFQVNTKHLNVLPLEWSKFVTDGKLTKIGLGLTVPMFQQGEDLIGCIDKAMAFLSAIASRGIATTLKVNVAAGPSRVVKCYNCQGEGHMARQYLGISEAPIAHQTIPQNSAFQTDNLGAYDLDYDDVSSAKVVLMANLSSCDPKVLSEVSYSDSYLNDMINQNVQEMQYFEQTHVDDFEDNEIHGGCNIISYSLYLQVTQDVVIQDTDPSATNDLLVLSLVEQMTHHVAYIDKENQINKMEIDTLKETLSNNVKEKESLSKRLTIFKTESKEKESKYIDKEIVLEEQNKELENIICKMYRTTKLKGKNVVNTVVSKPNVTNALGIINLDIEPISPRLKNNRVAHKIYIEKTMEYTNTLCVFIERARTQFAEPITSSNNIPKQIDSLKTKDFNKPLLTSTGVKPTTSASISKPSGNTKNNRITRPPRSNQNNKVEDHPRKVKSSLNKKNFVSEPISCPDRSLVSELWMFKTYDREQLSAHELRYEDLGKLNSKTDIGIFVRYGLAKKAFRIYNRRTQKIMETIHVTFDELTVMASEQFGSGPGLQVLTPVTSSLRLVPNIIPQQPCNLPKRYDWDTLFQPLFDEYFNPPTIVVSTVLVAAASRAVDRADSHVSTFINQDTSSSSIPSTQDHEYSPIISQGVEESTKTPLFHDDPLHESLHEDSTCNTPILKM
nr:integrase, catalytic region, zinc finger, CCHC-type, peptidase aspartic, catalytic [Tanacetum cinerariifolium]